MVGVVQFGNEGKDILLVLGCTVVRTYVVGADKVMPHPPLLFGCRSGSAYLHAPINLPAVAVQDWTAKHLSHLQGKFCLTHCRGA